MESPQEAQLPSTSTVGGTTRSMCGMLSSRLDMSMESPRSGSTLKIGWTVRGRQVRAIGLRALFRKEKMWQRHKLKPRYDVVVIGAGVHGLSIAYYLAKNHNITNLAVLDKVYLGGGKSDRNPALIRDNYMTVQEVQLYRERRALHE